MSKENAYDFLDNKVYRNEKREEQLRQTSCDDELIQLVLQMAQDEKWPTGFFDENNVKEAMSEKVINDYPPVYKTLTRLFREGRIAGSVAAGAFW